MPVGVIGDDNNYAPNPQEGGGITTVTASAPLVLTYASGDLAGSVEPFLGATVGVPGDAGVVPAPPAGSDKKFLCGDGTWKAVTVITGGQVISLTGDVTGDPDANTVSSLQGKILDLSGVANDQVIAYDSGLDKWLPVTLAGTGTVTSVAVNSPDAGLQFSVMNPTTTPYISISGGALDIAHGGTGNSTRADALDALLPSQSVATAGQGLVSNGTTASWGNPGMSMPFRTVTSTDSPVAVGTTDGFFSIDATADDIEVRLPLIATCAAGKIFVFKRWDGTNNEVKIVANSGDTIDNAANLLLSQRYESISIIGTGSGSDVSWRIF